MRKSIGCVIREGRERRGYFQYQLAKRVYLSKSALSRIELGQVKPDDETLCKLAKALNCRSLLIHRCEKCVIGLALQEMTVLKKAA